MPEVQKKHYTIFTNFLILFNIDGQILMGLWLVSGEFPNQPQIPFLKLFLAAAKCLNVPKIIVVVWLLICHVPIGSTMLQDDPYEIFDDL